MLEFVIIFIAEIFIGIVQYSYQNIADDIFRIYKGKSSIGTRSIGTFGLPYNYSVFIVFALLFFVSCSMYLKKYYYIFIPFAAFALISSQSKTGVYVFIFSILYAIVFILYTKIINMKNVILLTLCILPCIIISIINSEILLSLIFNNFPYYYYTGLFNIQEVIVSSFSRSEGRMNDMIWVLDQFKNYNIFSILFCTLIPSTFSLSGIPFLL